MYFRMFPWNKPEAAAPERMDYDDVEYENTGGPNYVPHNTHGYHGNQHHGHGNHSSQHHGNHMSDGHHHGTQYHDHRSQHHVHSNQHHGHSNQHHGHSDYRHGASHMHLEGHGIQGQAGHHGHGYGHHYDDHYLGQSNGFHGNHQAQAQEQMLRAMQGMNNISYCTRICGIWDLSGETDSYTRSSVITLQFCGIRDLSGEQPSVIIPVQQSLPPSGILTTELLFIHYKKNQDLFFKSTHNIITQCK